MRDLRSYGALVLVLLCLSLAAALVLVALPDDLDDGTVKTTEVTHD